MKLKKLRKQLATFALVFCTLVGQLPMSLLPLLGNEEDAAISVCVTPEEPTEDDFSPAPSTSKD